MLVLLHVLLVGSSPTLPVVSTGAYPMTHCHPVIETGNERLLIVSYKFGLMVFPSLLPYGG
jgi:hypothetical protein